MESGVEFTAADMPFANKLTIHILAAVAEYERKAISARTKAALDAAKARGVKLGGPKLKEAQRRGVASNKTNADRFAANVLPVIQQIRASGAMSLRAIAKALNARGVATARGGVWTPVQVTAVLRRAPFRTRHSPKDGIVTKLCSNIAARGPAALKFILLDGRLFIRHLDRIYITSMDAPRPGSRVLPATARAKARGRSP